MDIIRVDGYADEIFNLAEELCDDLDEAGHVNKSSVISELRKIQKVCGKINREIEQE